MKSRQLDDAKLKATTGFEYLVEEFNKFYMDAETISKFSRFNVFKSMKRESGTSLEDHMLRWANSLREVEVIVVEV